MFKKEGARIKLENIRSFLSLVPFLSAEIGVCIAHPVAPSTRC